MCGYRHESTLILPNVLPLNLPLHRIRPSACNAVANMRNCNSTIMCRRKGLRAFISLGFVQMDRQGSHHAVCVPKDCFIKLSTTCRALNSLWCTRCSATNTYSVYILCACSQTCLFWDLTHRTENCASLWCSLRSSAHFVKHNACAYYAFWAKQSCACSFY